MQIIDTEQLRARLDTGTAAVFDVRGDVEYERGHLPGSLTAPLGSLVFRVAGVMNSDSFLAVYSNGGSCPLARQAAARLEDLGLKNVHCYDEGLAGWRAAGLPVVESVQAKVHTRGPAVDCRPIVVDRERAYGGAFAQEPLEVAGAGG